VSAARRTRARQRGTTLIEILISVAVVLVGMLALFQTLGTSVTGSSTAAKLSQAQQRAVMVMENIRVAPPAALECLRATVASNWVSCEAICRANLTGTNIGADACVYESFLQNNSDLNYKADRSLQNYFLVASNGTSSAVSRVRLAGTGNRVYDAQVVIGWNNDNSDDSVKPNPDHWVTLRSGVFE
jgi:Tfp pilus assembly protein PilV